MYEGVRGSTREYQEVRGSTRKYEEVRGSTKEVPRKYEGSTREYEGVRGSTRRVQGSMGSTEVSLFPPWKDIDKCSVHFCRNISDYFVNKEYTTVLLFKVHIKLKISTQTSHLKSKFK